MVVPQQTAEPLATFNSASGLADLLARFQDRVTDPLVIAFLVVVGEIAAHCSTKHVLAKEDHSRKAL